MKQLRLTNRSAQSLKRSALLAASISLLDISNSALIGAMGNPVALAHGFHASTLSVLIAACASIVFIAIGGRLDSLRKHPSFFYCSVLISVCGLFALFSEEPSSLGIASFVAFSIGNVLLQIIWLELLLEVSSYELALTTVMASALSAIGTLVVNMLNQESYICVLSLFVSLLCLKYMDSALPMPRGNIASEKPSLDKRTLFATLVGLCFVGLVSGTIQSITVAEINSGPMYSSLSSVVVFVLLAILLLPANDLNILTAIKVISSFAIVALIVLLLSLEYAYVSYLLSSVAYGLLTDLTYYAAALIARSKFKPLRVFGIAGTVLYSSAILLALFSGLNLEFENTYFIAALTLVFAVASIWLIADRGIDLLLNPDRHATPGDAPSKLDFNTKATIVAEKHGLTPRETEVLLLASSGRSCPFIAEKLVISENTVKTYLQKVYAKCHVHSRQELISLVETTER